MLILGTCPYKTARKIDRSSPSPDSYKEGRLTQMEKHHMDDKKAFITFRLDPDLKEKFEQVSKDEDRYPAQVLRILVAEYVAKRIKHVRRPVTVAR